MGCRSFSMPIESTGANKFFKASIPSSSSGSGATTTTNLSFSSTGSKSRVLNATTSGAAKAMVLRYSNSCETFGNTILTRLRVLFNPSSPAATGNMDSSMNCTNVSGSELSSASRTSMSIRCFPPNIPANIAVPAASAASITDDGALPNIIASSNDSITFWLLLFVCFPLVEDEEEGDDDDTSDVLLLLEEDPEDDVDDVDEDEG
mmetsp:Transcript_42186/g.101481  ORF Transcript_42186/g.101481 Transcript_42186/m.101481 type:complete len:205 (-) Transcript_42186:1250-1864(-)